MKSSVFTILSKYRLDAHESSLSEFYHEDLKAMIEGDSIVVTDPEILDQVKKDNADYSFEYTITIERKE